MGSLNVVNALVSDNGCRCDEKGTEKCFVRKAGLIYHIDLHASVDGNLSVTQGHEIAHLLKDTLKRTLPQLGNVLIHIEPFK